MPLKLPLQMQTFQSNVRVGTGRIYGPDKYVCVSSDSVSETAGYGLFVSDGGQPRAKIELDAANKELVFHTTYGIAPEGLVDYVFR